MLPCACFVHDDWKLSASCANWRNWTKRHRSHKIQYYKVHFQYYKLLSTTKYTSSTTKYYEVLQSPLQYYKVIQSITSYYKKPPSTAKYYSGTTPYYKVLNLQQVLRLPRKLTLELHQVLRLPRKVTLDLHQVLRLPHRMTRRLDPRHIWNVISNARRNKCHPPNSPNTAPATQNDHPTSGRNLRKIAETSFPMRGRSETVPRPFRAWSEPVSVSPQPATPPRLLFTLRTNGLYWKIQHFALRLSFQISPSTAPTTKSDTWTSPSTAPTTQSDTWTSPSTAPTTKTDTWTSPSTAPTTKSDTWPSPSTAPATQNDSQAWSSSHMKRHFQCAQKQMSPSKLTKYCACHAKWPSNIWQKFAENSWNVSSNARPIRDRSETVPSMIRDRFRQSATRHSTEVTFSLRTNGLSWKIQQNDHPTSGRNLRKTAETSVAMRGRSETVPRPFRAWSETVSVSPQPATQPRLLFRSGRTVCLEKYNISRSGYLSKFHQVYCAYHEKWHLNFTKYCAYHAKWHLNFTKYCAYHENWHLNFTKYCAYHEKWHLTFTKYCACHTEWLAGLILVTYETSFPMRAETNVTLQTHQILRLPRKMTIQHLQKFAENSWNVISNARPIRDRSETVPSMIRDRLRQSATRHATEVTFRAPDERFVLKNTTFRAPAIFPNFTKSCAYHAKWHLNFTKYCAYHENSHLNFTKYCAYHEKWHLTFTKYCACHTEWLAGLILVTYETSFPMRAETNVTLQTHQILRLPRKMTIQHLAEICGKQLKRHFQCAADPRPFRDRSEHDPRPFASVRNPPRNRGCFSRSGRTVCIEKYNISRSGYLSKFHQVLRLPLKVPLELHQVLRLPRKVTLELHQVLRLPRKVTLDLHQVLRLPHRMTRDCNWQYYYAAILLDSTTNWVYCYAAIVLDSTTTQWF